MNVPPSKTISRKWRSKKDGRILWRYYFKEYSPGFNRMVKYELDIVTNPGLLSISKFFEVEYPYKVVRNDDSFELPNKWMLENIQYPWIVWANNNKDHNMSGINDEFSKLQEIMSNICYMFSDGSDALIFKMTWC